MVWRKDFNLPFETLLYIASVFLFLGSLYFHSIWLFLFVLLFCLINVTTHFYLNYMADHLVLDNPRHTVRLFANDEDVFFFRPGNVGKWPLFSGSFEWVLENHVEAVEFQKINSDQKQNKYGVRLHLDGEQNVRIPLKIKGVKRGAVKVRNIRLTVRDWFGIGSVNLDFDPLYHTEIIVYPELRIVHGLERVQTVWQGANPTQYSLDEDLTAPTGTRDYFSGDSFHRIHWKASAKAGHLQTKVYEKTNGMTWVMMLNVSRDSLSSAALEREISCLAYICKFAVEHGIPFELYTNVKSRGRGALLHLPLGEGRDQLAKALELLARVNLKNLTLPTYRIFSYVDSQQYQNPVMILSHLSYKDDPNGILQKWKKKRFGLYNVLHNEDSAYVVRLEKAQAVS